MYRFYAEHSRQSLYTPTTVGVKGNIRNRSNSGWSDGGYIVCLHVVWCNEATVFTVEPISNVTFVWLSSRKYYVDPALYTLAPRFTCNFWGEILTAFTEVMVDLSDIFLWLKACCCQAFCSSDTSCGHVRGHPLRRKRGPLLFPHTTKYASIVTAGQRGEFVLFIQNSDPLLKQVCVWLFYPYRHYLWVS